MDWRLIESDAALRQLLDQAAGCEAVIVDTEFMRRNHMTLLQHEHDETRVKDIRSEGYSLKECLACHAVTRPDGRPDAKPVTADSPEHFCRSCHDYAAVKIDCFECHRSRGRRSLWQDGRQSDAVRRRQSWLTSI